MVKKISLYIILVFCLFGCRPKGILHSWEMRDLLIELHQTDALLQAKGLTNNQEVKAEITVTNMIERSYTFTAKDIKLAGESKDLNYQFAEGTQVIVTLRGKRELINGITRSSIDISADVSALTAGENAQEAVVIADPGIDVTSIVCNPETVNVKVTAKAGD